MLRVEAVDVLARLLCRLGEDGALLLADWVGIGGKDEAGGGHMRPPRLAETETIEGGSGMPSGEASEGVEEALDENAAVLVEGTGVEDPLRAWEEVVAQVFGAEDRRPAVQREEDAARGGEGSHNAGLAGATPMGPGAARGVTEAGGLSDREGDAAALEVPAGVISGEKLLAPSEEGVDLGASRLGRRLGPSRGSWQHRLSVEAGPCRAAVVPVAHLDAGVIAENANSVCRREAADETDDVHDTPLFPQAWQRHVRPVEEIQADMERSPCPCSTKFGHCMDRPWCRSPCQSTISPMLNEALTAAKRSEVVGEAATRGRMMFSTCNRQPGGRLAWVKTATVVRWRLG